MVVLSKYHLTVYSYNKDMAPAKLDIFVGLMKSDNPVFKTNAFYVNFTNCFRTSLFHSKQTIKYLQNEVFKCNKTYLRRSLGGGSYYVLDYVGVNRNRNTHTLNIIRYLKNNVNIKRNKYDFLP